MTVGSAGLMSRLRTDILSMGLHSATTERVSQQRQIQRGLDS